jgi:2-furoyl-CoA dehydrogenase FAD binding subunit
VKPAPFAYVRVHSVEEACHWLRQEGDGARILAGGQSLAAMLNMRIATPSLVIDINRIEGLDRINEEKTALVTGALVRQAGALASPMVAKQLPLLAAALPHIGHYQTRSRGTLAGSAAHADPSAEIPLVLAVLGGQIELTSRRRRRRVPARDFFVSALTTSRLPEEMVTALHWPHAAPGAYYGFREYALRAGDYAIAAAACKVRKAETDSRGHFVIGFAGCGERPQILDFTFAEEEFGAAAFHEWSAVAMNTVECRSDLHASAAYRRQLAGLLVKGLAGKALDFFEQSRLHGEI